MTIKTRHIVATILFFVGFLLLMGAVGSMEIEGLSFGEFWIRTTVGGLMIGSSIPVAGEIKDN